MTDPICTTCTKRHGIAESEIGIEDSDPGCDWDTFPGFGWRDWYTNHGWILHEDIQHEQPIWMKPIGYGMWQEYSEQGEGRGMTWTAEEYAICFKRLED